MRRHASVLFTDGLVSMSFAYSYNTSYIIITQHLMHFIYYIYILMFFSKWTSIQSHYRLGRVPITKPPSVNGQKAAWVQVFIPSPSNPHTHTHIIPILILI